MAKKLALIGLAAACFVLLGSAPAAEQDVRFAIADVHFRLPLPAGFCLPTPSIEALGRRNFANTNSISLVVIVRCGTTTPDPLQDYTVITAFADSAGESISRQELLRNLGPSFDRPEYRDFVAKESKAPIAVEGATGAESISLVGPPAPLGHDDVCLYLGGERGPSADYPYSTRVVACLTSVKGKVLAIYRYADPRSVKTFGELLRQARAIALSIAVER